MEYIDKTRMFMKKFNPYKLAACGVDCNDCAQYKVTMEKDLSSVELLVEWFRNQGWIGENEGTEAVIKKAPLCYGCWDITEECFWQCGCGSIDFRLCCKEKQIDHCGECDIFPCEPYKNWIGTIPTHIKAYEYLTSLRKNK